MEPLEIETNILKCIKEHGMHGASSTEISKALGINRHTLAKYLNVLNAEGKITFKRVGMGKIWFIQRSPLTSVLKKAKDTSDTGLKMALQHILSTIPDGIVVENENYEIEFMNDSLIKKFGDVVGEKCYKTFIGRDEPCEECPVREILHKGNLTPMRYQATDKDGNFYDLIASPIKNPDGSTSVIEMVRDITKMKRAEEALRENEERFRTVADFTYDWEYWIGPDGKYRYVSPSCEHITGYSADEFLNDPELIKKITHPDDRVIVDEQIHFESEQDRVITLEFRIITRSGVERWIEHICQSVYGTDDRWLGRRVSNRDITERKKAEEAIKESEEKYRTLVENARDAIFSLDMIGRFTYFSNRAEQISGYKSEDVLGKHFKTIVPMRYMPICIDRFQKGIRGLVPEPFVIELKGKSGELIPLEITGTALKKEGKIIGTMGLAKDIREMKKAEEAIKESEEKYRTIVENIPDVVYSCLPDEISTTLFITSNVERISGYKPDDFYKNPSLLWSLVHPQDLDKVSERYKKSIKTGEEYHLLYRFMHRNGKDFTYILDHGVSARDKNGRVIRYEGVMRDITERKRAEEALWESEEMYKTLVETSPDAVTVTDLEGNITYVSQRTIELHGFESADELLGRSAFELITPEDHEKAMANLQKTLKKGFVRDLEYNLLRKDGTSFTGELSVALIKGAYGKPKVFIATTRDITERKWIEGALLESESKYRTIFESANDGIVTIDPDGNLMNVNRVAEEITGYRKEDVLGTNLKELQMFSPENLNLILENFSKRISGIDVPPYEVELITKDGERKVVEISATVLKRGDKVVGDVAILRDITERKRAEEQIKYLNEIKRSVISNAPLGILTGDTEGNIIHVNPAMIQILGSPSEKKTKGFNLFKLPALKKAGLDKIFKKVLREGREFSLEKEYVSHWGKRIFARIRVSPLRDSEGEITGLVTIVEDITEKKILQNEVHRLKKKLKSRAPVPEPLPIPEAQSRSH